MLPLLILIIPPVILDIYAFRKYRDMSEGIQTSRYFIVLSILKKTAASSKFPRILLILYFGFLGLFILGIIIVFSL